MSARRPLAALCIALLASAAQADVSYDASSAAEAPLRFGSTYLIQELDGVQRGGNLFHGFARFELAPGETALFRPTLPELRDPLLPPIERVIARVSGGVPSSIRGLIDSHEYAADFYLLNPSGVVFGPGAALDVNGAFVASTADVLRLGPEALEIALDRPDPFPLLAVAPPSSFGFLGAGPAAPIRVQDTLLAYRVNGGTLALLGDALEFENARVFAPNADLYAAAVASGDVAIDAENARFEFAGVDSGGPILLSGSVLNTSGVELGFSGAGDIILRGGDLTGIDSSLFALTNGDEDGGDIDVTLDSELLLERRSIQGAGIFTESQLDQFAERVAKGSGSSGDIRIRARDVTLLGGAYVGTRAFGAGSAGRIELDVARRAYFSGRDRTVESLDRSGLFSATSGGPAGAIELRAQQLVMDDSSAIVGETRSDVSGAAIDVQVEQLELTGNARIDSSTRGTGDGGSIRVRASESIWISGRESDQEFSGITALAQPGAQGSPGSVELDLGGTGRLLLDSGGEISVSSLGARAAGSLRVQGASEIELRGGSRIASSAVEASDGGNIDLQARERLELEDSQISASVAGGTGGNIEIDPDFVILRNGQIVAEAGTGTGGNIEISAGVFVADSLSRVSASSRSGVDGTVVIRSPDVDVSDELAALPEEFVDPANLLADRCAARAASARGSLTLRELDALPDWPGRARPARFPLEPAASRDRELRDAFGAARAAERRGELALALERWQQAGALASSAPLRAAAQLGSAQALERSGRAQRALEALDAADSELADRKTGNLALASAALRARIRSDREALARALEVARSDDARARIGAELAALRAEAGLRSEALRGWSEAERLARAAGDLALAFALQANRLALQLGSSDAPAADVDLDAFWRSLEGVPDEHDADYAALHVAMAELQRPSGADQLGQRLERLAARAARRGDARAESFARTLRARWLGARGDPDRAVESARSALLLAQRARAPEAELLASPVLGRELAALGQRAAAVTALERAWALRAGRFSGIADAHASSSANAAWLEPAALLDALVDQLLRLAAETEEPAERERLLLRARDHLDDRTALALREYFADECVASQRSVSLATLPGAVVVYPALLPDRVELIVSGPGGTRSVLAGAGPDEILREAQALAELSQQRTSRRYRRPAGQLYDWLIRPLEAELGGGERTLVVVPRGALLRVPWAALWDARSRSHLIERFALAIAPGLTLAESHPVSRDVRALKAGLSQGVQGFSALPAVTRELGEVSSFYGGPVLLDEGFNARRLEAALRSEPYGVVHIASHASFGASADDAYVVTYDGRLGARELAELVELTRFRERPLELLTLSACETSAGDERAALGLAGLAVRAGARSTLGTLWPVNDEAAAELVGRFYRELARPGGTRAEALRRAQRAALAQPRIDHPAYWSPFVMIGSWQ